jgi:hypothetical protein
MQDYCKCSLELRLTQGYAAPNARNKIRTRGGAAILAYFALVVTIIGLRWRITVGLTHLHNRLHQYASEMGLHKGITHENAA